MVRKSGVFHCQFSTYKQYYVLVSRLIDVLSQDSVVPVSCVGLLELLQKFMFLMVNGEERTSHHRKTSACYDLEE